mmetsp:Transcript_2519/g.9051  ORF Transcript_2519/g.9051 Transcript_2519/m.9051 type:complete len:655 (+) Transcript_2519:127-2091(+)
MGTIMTDPPRRHWMACVRLCQTLAATVLVASVPATAGPQGITHRKVGRGHLTPPVDNADPNAEHRYATTSEILDRMKELPSRCQVAQTSFAYGQSGKGTDMWAAIFTSSVNPDEIKPLVKYVGNIHGNEPLGRQLLMYFIDHLCENYGKDEEITSLLDNTRLLMVPTMNPDGYDMHTRGNSNGKDLNRDFPDQYVGKNHDINARQPETRAMMDLSEKYPCQVGVGFHEGALVANYAWDGLPSGSEARSRTPNVTPDNDVMIHLARVYAANNPPMRASPEFKDGVTNGAAWYPLYGGMQDWDYIHNNCIFLTVELNDRKWPTNAILGQAFGDNIRSLIEIAKASHQGIEGFVTEEGTGHTIESLLVVEGRNHPSYTHGQGHFFRLLMPGKYNITVRSRYHYPRMEEIDVGLDGLTTFNVSLTRRREPVRAATYHTVDGVVKEMPPNRGLYRPKPTVGSQEASTLNARAVSTAGFGAISLGDDDPRVRKAWAENLNRQSSSTDTVTQNEWVPPSLEDPFKLAAHEEHHTQLIDVFDPGSTNSEAGIQNSETQFNSGTNQGSGMELFVAMDPGAEAMRAGTTETTARTGDTGQYFDQAKIEGAESLGGNHGSWKQSVLNRLGLNLAFILLVFVAVRALMVVMFRKRRKSKHRHLLGY